MSSDVPDTSSDAAEKVRIAQIGYRQAVTVAVISCLSTFLVTLVGGYFALPNRRASPQQEVKQRFITITGIQRASSEFRLRIDVNGYSYTYPAKNLWADPSALSLPVSFPIVNDSTYRVYFCGWEKLGNNVEPFAPQPIDVIKFSGGTENRTSSMTVPLAVQFEIHE